MQFFKIIIGTYKCPIIATVEHTKQAIQLGETGGSAIKETSSLHYDANLILTVVLKQVIGMEKLIDVLVSKNKFSTFIGTLPFRFYPELSRMDECEGNASIFTGGVVDKSKQEAPKEEKKDGESKDVPETMPGL